MRATLKVDILKTVFILFYFMLVLTAINAWATKKNEQNSQLGEQITADEKSNCYNTQKYFRFESDKRRSQLQ